MTGVVEVETFPEKRVVPSNPSRVPVQSPVAFRVRALLENCRPVPVKSLKVSPPIVRLVVEAVMNDEYAVEEEYGEDIKLAAVTLPRVSMVVEAVPPTFNQLAESNVEEAEPKSCIREVVADIPAEG